MVPRRCILLALVIPWVLLLLPTRVWLCWYTHSWSPFDWNNFEPLTYHLAPSSSQSFIVSQVQPHWAASTDVDFKQSHKLDKCLESKWNCLCPYFLQEGDMPEEVNIDDLIDLPTDEERVKKLQVTWTVWTFIVKETADYEIRTGFFFVFFFCHQFITLHLMGTVPAPTWIDFVKDVTQIELMSILFASDNDRKRISGEVLWYVGTEYMIIWLVCYNINPAILVFTGASSKMQKQHRGMF